MDKTFEDQNPSLLKAELDDIASSRKKDHIEMALKSQMATGQLDDRFYYEPLLSGHPNEQTIQPFSFLGKTMHAPLWISSMTGGTKEAYVINHNLAKACGEFGLGMGLGSCRALLYSDERLKDFDLRDSIGNNAPFYANLGVAQLEELIEKKAMDLVDNLVHKLQADGLIIHVNPFQEWLQPEGDHFKKSPVAIIQECLAYFNFPIIVKEVGQGMGPKSLKALMQLPLAAIDFASSGGTNFALLELLRSEGKQKEHFLPLANQGHAAKEMVGFVNEHILKLGEKVKVKEFIISGGIKSFLDGYYLTNKLQSKSVYGQASAFLKHARGNYSDLQDYIAAQIEGLGLANNYLSVR